MLAASRGDEPIVRLMATKEGTACDSNRMTALMFAAGGGHYTCVPVLLAARGFRCQRRTALELTLVGYSERYRWAAEPLWEEPAERQTQGLFEVQRRWLLPRLGCEWGLCGGARGLLEAAIVGCGRCCRRLIN